MCKYVYNREEFFFITSICAKYDYISIFWITKNKTTSTNKEEEGKKLSIIPQKIHTIAKTTTTITTPILSF
jgi:hypothetical protein